MERTPRKLQTFSYFEIRHRDGQETYSRQRRVIEEHHTKNVPLGETTREKFLLFLGTGVSKSYITTRRRKTVNAKHVPLDKKLREIITFISKISHRDIRKFITAHFS